MNETIYKYIDLKGLECILKNETLKFTKPSDFNDPFEFHEALVDRKLKLEHWIQIYKKRENKLSKERKKELIETFKNNNQKLQDDIDKQFYNQKATTKISCFSEINDSFLMWSHYADKHKGACIGFSTERLKTFFKTDSQFCKVKYYREIHSKNISNHRVDAIVHWICSKGKTWNYEKEIRIILGSNPTEFQKIDTTLIKQVIFGCNVANEEKERIEKLIFEQRKYDWIKTSEMKISNKKFKLNNCNRH